jgi:hypothetical protein
MRGVGFGNGQRLKRGFHGAPSGAIVIRRCLSREGCPSNSQAGKPRTHCENSHFSPRVGASPACSVFRSVACSGSTLWKKTASPCLPLNSSEHREFRFAAVEIGVQVDQERQNPLTELRDLPGIAGIGRVEEVVVWEELSPAP